MRFAVLAAGEIRNAAFCRQAAKACDGVLCADGGANHLAELGIAAQHVIGDMDSANDLPEGIKLSRLSRDKDYSDSEAAVELAIAEGAKEVLLIGAGGLRPDHHFANLKLLGRFPMHLRMIDGDHEIVALNQPYTFSAEIGETCSLIPLGTEPIVVSAKGLKFPLDKLRLSPTSHGLSNQTIANEVTIDIDQGTLLLFRIWQPFLNRKPLAI